MNITLDVFDPASVQAAIRQLEEYADSLERKTHDLCQRLADIGYEVSAEILGQHIYTGETLGSLEVVEVGENRFILEAGSTALLFLEFGAGINGGGHPLAGDFGMGPGTYPGQTHAFDPNGWWYPTEDANLVVITRDKFGQGFGHSYGNPPYMPMYNASRQIRDDLLRTAREVFDTT